MPLLYSMLIQFNNYSSSVSYSYLGGSENRLTISTTGTYLSLLFATGPNTFTSVVGLIGFNEVDYVGSTAYVGSQTTGTVLIPSQIGYNYLDDQNTLKVFGAVNVSASGLKETVTFNFLEFVQVEFMYEDKSRLLEWKNFWMWAIQQRDFDFIPEITNPTRVFQVTLRKRIMTTKAWVIGMKEMLPSFPNTYQTGALVLGEL